MLKTKNDIVRNWLPRYTGMPLLFVRKILQFSHLDLPHDEVHQVGLELQDGHRVGEMVGDVGDAAAHGFHRLVDELVGIHFQGVGQIRHLRGEQQPG